MTVPRRATLAPARRLRVVERGMATRTRAQSGEGAVYWLASRGRWMIAFRDVDGRRKVRTSPTQTERGARAYLRQLLSKRDQGEALLDSPRLRDYVPRFLDIKRTQDVRPRTLEAYSERLTKHVLPRLGALKLDQITPRALDDLFSILAASGLGPTTVALVHDVLRSLLRTAHLRGLVPTVVTERVESPKRRKFDATTLSVDEAQALISGATDHRHGPLFIFLLGTGCRFGEATGLRWSDLVFNDDGTAIAHIRQQSVRVRDPQTRRVSYRLAPVKTDAGRRTVHLPPFVVAALSIQQTMAAAMRATHDPRKRAAPWPDLDLVFPGHRGKLLPENSVSVTWDRLLRRLGLPDVRMHDLRHTKGTLMADAGEDLVVIQQELGHARSSITADLYIGRVPTARRHAARRYGELIGAEKIEQADDT